MSMVERLAAKALTLGLPDCTVEMSRTAARWWLNAIADELNAEDARRTEGRRHRYLYHKNAADYLRNAAQEPTE